MTLAASIAVATTAFGLARAVLWRALPFDDASRLVFVWEESERDGLPQPSRVTGARYAAWRDQGRRLLVAGAVRRRWLHPREPRRRRVRARHAGVGQLLRDVGHPTVAGPRVPARRPACPAAIASSSCRRRSGTNATAGAATSSARSCRLSGEPYTIVGVMPPVTFPAWPVNPAAVTLDPESRQLWVPIPRTAELDQSGRAHVFGVVGRLAPGVERACGDRAAERHIDCVRARSASRASGAAARAARRPTRARRCWCWPPRRWPCC